MLSLDILGWVDTAAWLLLIGCMIPGTWRHIQSKRDGGSFADSMRAVIALAGASRFSFALIRWYFGSHHDVMTQPEMAAKSCAYAFGLICAVAFLRAVGVNDPRRDS